ncbi:Transcription initiation protein spt3 [Chytriomyces hyalinus]|nr:Transcription initiation protein spt3 [Chytriomyces hyalinus]
MISRAIYFGQGWALDSSAMVHERLRIAFNSGDNATGWTRTVRLYLANTSTAPNSSINTSIDQPTPTASTTQKSTSKKLLVMASAGNSFALTTQSSKQCFVHTDGTELESIIARLKTSWTARQAIRIDGTRYTLPNTVVPMIVCVGAVTVGSMPRGVVVEVQVLTDNEQEAVTAIRTFLKKLFRDIPGFTSLGIDTLIPLTFDAGTSGAEWLKKGPFGVAHSSYSLMRICNTEIAQMMFVFGDTSEPADETVALVEDLTRTQIGELIIQAVAQALKRSSKSLSPEDIIFLIRNDAKKVNRLKQYLSWKDVRKNVKDKGAAGPTDVVQEDGEELLDNEPSKLKPRKMTVKFSWELVNSFSNLLEENSAFTDPSSTTTTGDDTTATTNIDLEPSDSIMEDHEARAAYEEQIMRLKVADEITRDMTREEYVYYSECRQASFTFKKAKKFRDWSGLHVLYKNKPASDVFDVLGFLACECVARLTETALKVKKQWDLKDKNSRRGALGGGGSGEEQIGLFGRNAVDQSSLSPRHVQEAFRRLQRTTFPMNNFKGGMIRSPLTIF